MFGLRWLQMTIASAPLTLAFLCAGAVAQDAHTTPRHHEPQLWPGDQDHCPSSVLDLDKLVTLLGSDDATERWAAAECLGEMKDARAVEPLVRAIFKEKYPRIAMIERNALRDINDPRAGDMLLEALKDKRTRWTAAYSLGDLQVDRAVEPLIALLKSTEKDDRSSAAEALGRIKDQRATDSLCAALKDRDEVVEGM